MEYDFALGPSIIFDGAEIDRETWRGEGHVVLTIDTEAKTAKWSWYRADDMTLNEYDVPISFPLALDIVLNTFARAAR